MSPLSRRDALALGAAVALPTLTCADEPKPKIKVGQIGTAHAHASKLAVYRSSADYEVVGVVEPDEGRRKLAELTPACRGVKWVTREELLATPGLQAVLVETRVADLLDAAEACVAAGKYVHIDKPAGASLPQLKRVLDAATKKKLIVQMGYMFRYNPAVVMLRECLKNGWLGEVYEVHAVMGKVVGPAERKGLAAFKGGIMFELGCHVLDLVVGILGKPAAVAGFNRHTSKLPDTLADNMLAVLSYPRATATVRASAIEIEGGNRRHLVVCGTEGTFHIQPLDNPAAVVSLSQARGPYKKGTQDVKFPKYNRYVDDAADMAKVIRGEAAFAFTPEHDLAVQEALLTACEMAVG